MARDRNHTNAINVSHSSHTSPQGKRNGGYRLVTVEGMYSNMAIKEKFMNRLEGCIRHYRAVRRLEVS
eukprot:539497-Amorphochlora_amoeboformis.AAC.1